MTENQIQGLPEYPCVRDMWDELAKEKRPILVYGMGNGADKLFERFNQYGITPTDVFASDGFVRGHSFRGIRVKSFSEVKAQYSDFVIVLSFASSRREVLDMLYDMDEHYDVYVPDMPVAGGEYFDRAFFNDHYDEILRASCAFEDDHSKHIYNSIIAYKISGRMRYLKQAFVERIDELSLLPLDKITTFVDAGAYNGDTVREAVRYIPGLKKAVAVEPDARNYKKLLRYAEQSEIRVECINAAVWSDDGQGAFSSSGNRNSSISSTDSYEHKDMTVGLVSIDSLGVRPDYIKYDVEGAEFEALVGADKTIRECRPSVILSLYHRSRDIFFLINFVKEKYPWYRMYLRRTECLPAWEIDLVLINEDA